MTLAYHRGPELGESAPGYLLRLADKNGYFDLPELLLETQKIGSYRQDSHMDKLSELAMSLGDVGCDSLLEPTSIKLNSAQAQTLTYKPVLNKSPRVCTSCMTQGSPIKADWHVMQITHCKEHQQPLLTTCTCGKSFVWDESLLSYGCSSCGKGWFEFDKIHENLPKFLEVLFCLDVEYRADFINDITAAALTRVRPYDSIVDVHHLSPKHTSNWVKFLSDGYNLLTKPEDYELWIASCADARKAFKPLGNRSVFYPFYSLISKLRGDWLVKVKHPKICNTPPVENRLVSEVRSLNNKRNIMAGSHKSSLKDDAYIHHINRETLADMLEIDVSLARAIFKLSALESYTNNKLKRNNISCIKDFLNNVTSISLDIPSNVTPLSDITPFLKEFGATLSDVLIAIYQCNVQGYMNLSKENFLESIQVNKSELAEYLSDQFMRDESRIFSMTQVTRILGLPRNIVSQIALYGGIEEISSPKNQHNYTASSIAKFLDDHIVISTWTDIYDLCEAKVIKTLKESGFKAVWGHNAFAETTGLLSLLNSIKVRDSWKMSKQLSLI